MIHDSWTGCSQPPNHQTTNINNNNNNNNRPQNNHSNKMATESDMEFHDDESYELVNVEEFDAM